MSMRKILLVSFSVIAVILLVTLGFNRVAVNSNSDNDSTINEKIDVTYNTDYITEDTVDNESDDEIYIDPITEDCQGDKTLSVYVKNQDLRSKSEFTGEELDIALKGTNLEGLGESFSSAELNYGVNSAFLISVARLESGNGTSSLTRTHNNIFGITNGSGKYSKFSSLDSCIDYAGNLLSTDYLTESGKYFSGGYTAFHVNKRYCELSDWHTKIEQLMEETYSKINNYYNSEDVIYE